MTSVLISLAFLFAGAVAVYALLLLYRITAHPLAWVPGPLGNKLTGWIDSAAADSGRRHLALHELHERYGPVVRFAPNKVSFNTVTALQTLNGHRKANVIKGEFYRIVQAAEQGHSTFNTSSAQIHARKRRVLAHAFSEKGLQDMEYYVSQNINIWLDKLGSGPVQQDKWLAPKDISVWISYLVLDVLTDLCFGRSFDSLNKPDFRYVPHLIMGTTSGVVKMSASPFASILRQLMFKTPLGDILGGQEIADTKKLFELAKTLVSQRRDLEMQNEKAGTIARTDFFHYLFRGFNLEYGRSNNLEELYPESMLMLIAGSDTTSTTIAASIYNLLRNPNVLEKLRAELKDNFKSLDEIRYHGTALPRLTYLHAVINESLRQSPPVAGILPRETVGDGITVDGNFFPPGYEIGVSVYAVQHNEAYFPDPYTFKPERFIEGFGFTKEQIELANSAMCAFNIGARGCVGKNLAWMEMCLAISRFVWRFDMVEVEGWEKEIAMGFEGLHGEYPVKDWFAAENVGPVVRLKERADS